MTRLGPAGEHRYIPFGIKLMLTYVIFIVIPVVLIGYTAHSMFTVSIRDRTQDIYRGTLEQMQDNIQYKMNDMSRVSGMLYFDTSLSSVLRHYEEGWVSYEATTKQLLPKIQTTVEAANNRMRLVIYLHNTSLPEIYRIYGDDDPLGFDGILFDLYHVQRIQDRSWYKNYPEEVYGETMQWRQIERDGELGHISLLRRLVDTTSPLEVNEIGFMRITIMLSELLESVDSKKIGEGTRIYVVNQEQRILFASGVTKEGDGDYLTGELLSNTWVIESDLENLDWQLVALVPTDIVEEYSRKVKMLTIIISLACCVVFIVAGLFLSRVYSRKVSRIVRQLDAFQEGDFEKMVHFKGKDEFSRISVAINEMGQNIDELIHEVYMTSMKKKEAELETLQAQINPHFLYNTLSSISRLAKFGEVDKLQRMVLDLAKFYRLSLNEGRTVIPVSHELEQVTAYLNIQKTKFAEGLEVMYDVDPAILKFTTVKLILQPFIENALEHAWYGERIHIRIVATLEGDCIDFRVIDDGAGFAPDTLQQLSDPMARMTLGYGIRNVDERIRLHYGEAYGVTIASGRGIGTTVRIVIPAVVEGEGDGVGKAK